MTSSETFSLRFDHKCCPSVIVKHFDVILFRFHLAPLMQSTKRYMHPVPGHEIDPIAGHKTSCARVAATSPGSGQIATAACKLR